MIEYNISKSGEGISLFISNYVHQKLASGLSESLQAAFEGIVERPDEIALLFNRPITAQEETEAKTIVLANSNNAETNPALSSNELTGSSLETCSELLCVKSKNLSKIFAPLGGCFSFKL